jgi:hypothetical protein
MGMSRKHGNKRLFERKKLRRLYSVSQPACKKLSWLVRILFAGIVLHGFVVFMSDDDKGSEGEGQKERLQSEAGLVSSPKALTSLSQKYVASRSEEYIMEHSAELGYGQRGKRADGCNIWSDPSVSSDEIHKSLVSYGRELDNYNDIVKNFEPIEDLLPTIQREGSWDVCEKARPHKDGIESLFPSHQLSFSKSGFIEPLTPPMRSHHICKHAKQNLMELTYLVHDFEQMCHNLKPYSKRVLIDMGASLEYHDTDEFGPVNDPPILTLIDQYQKFGFVFDHIFGFEMTPIPPKQVFQSLPQQLLNKYHWINVPVSPQPNDRLNPLHSILKTFSPHDFIVVKLDIDTPTVELPLVKQLLDDPGGTFHTLIDHFYFEHHVRLKQLAPWWRSSMKGTVEDSLHLFKQLRENGIPAHFWP